MSCREIHEKEIVTIKKRTITLSLSDADCERIAKKAGSAGMTVGELLESFIGDLVDGTYSNGSDECYLADQWFDRCEFGMFPEDTLLKRLIDDWTDVEKFLDTVDDIKTAEEDLKAYKENPEEYDEEEVSCMEYDLQCWRENYHDAVDKWVKKHENADMEKEIDNCRKWLKEYQEFLGEE